MDTQVFQADILVLDAEDRPVMIVEVKSNFRYRQALERQIEVYLRESRSRIEFVMLVDYQKISLNRWDGGELSKPLFAAKTAKALSAYDPDFSKKTIFEFYMITLVEAWLHDMAYHWQSEHPPFYAEMQNIGLASRLKGGTTRREVTIAA